MHNILFYSGLWILRCVTRLRLFPNFCPFRGYQLKVTNILIGKSIIFTLRSRSQTKFFADVIWCQLLRCTECWNTTYWFDFFEYRAIIRHHSQFRTNACLYWTWPFSCMIINRFTWEKQSTGCREGNCGEARLRVNMEKKKHTHTHNARSKRLSRNYVTHLLKSWRTMQMMRNMRTRETRIPIITGSTGFCFCSATETSGEN